MMRMMMAAALLPLAGCTVQLNTKAICIEERPQAFIGQVWTESAARRIKQMSQAYRVRTVRPGDMVTMEFNKRRVNIAVDERNRITRIYCG